MSHIFLLTIIFSFQLLSYSKYKHWNYSLNHWIKYFHGTWLGWSGHGGNEKINLFVGFYIKCLPHHFEYETLKSTAAENWVQKRAGEASNKCAFNRITMYISSLFISSTIAILKTSAQAQSTVGKKKKKAAFPYGNGLRGQSWNASFYISDTLLLQEPFKLVTYLNAIWTLLLQSSYWISFQTHQLPNLCATNEANNEPQFWFEKLGYLRT